MEAATSDASMLEIERRPRPVHPLLVHPVALHLMWAGLLRADLDVSLDGVSLLRPSVGGGDVVNAGLDGVVALRPGARFVFDGEGGRHTLRDARDS